MFKEYDVGTIMMVLSQSPEVYEVEFSDKSGEPL